jgi:hypothetical protein
MSMKNFWKQFGRKMFCVAIQVVMIVSTVTVGAYLLSRSDCGKVVTHELCKGLIGGVVGGLAVGAFLAVNKLGAA